MITRLQVRGFKSLLDVDVTLGPLTVFVGANGSGKTSVLEAIDFLQDEVQPERHIGLEQAREGSPHRDRIAIGVAVPEREAWLVAGFQPRDDAERTALAAERQRLGFDPCLEPHSLRGGEKRSAKKVIAALTADDREQERQCITDPPLEHLCERGDGCGLAAFIDDVKTRVAPVIARG